MNTIIETDVIVKNEGGEILTYVDMQEIIRKEVSKFYYKYSAIRAHYDIEDIVDEVCLYYLSPMKHFDSTRLNHYVEKYNGDIKHLKNLFKLTSRQWLNMVLRDKQIKHKDVSLNNVISGMDDKLVELQDLMSDDSIDIESRLREEEFLNDILADLRFYNLMYMCNYIKDKSVKITSLDIDVDRLTQLHLSLLKDIIAGYKVKELKSKYEDYEYLITGVREVLNKKYKVINGYRSRVA